MSNELLLLLFSKNKNEDEGTPMKYWLLSGVFFFIPIWGSEKESAAALTCKYAEKEVINLVSLYQKANNDEESFSQLKQNTRWHEQFHIEESLLSGCVPACMMQGKWNTFHLQHIIKNDYISVIRSLIAHNGDFITKKVDDKGRTLLHYALIFKKRRIAALLFHHLLARSGSAALTLTDKAGFTFAHYAVVSDIPELLYALIRLGIKVNQQCREGSTPLLLAVEKNKKEMIDILLAHPNIEVMLPTYRGRTPLHSAIMNDDSSLCEALLEKITIASVSYAVLLDMLLGNASDISFLQYLSFSYSFPDKCG